MARRYCCECGDTLAFFNCDKASLRKVVSENRYGPPVEAPPSGCFGGGGDTILVVVEDMGHRMLGQSSDCDIQPKLDDDARDRLVEAVDIPGSDEVVEGPCACLRDDESDEASVEEDLAEDCSGREAGR